VALFFASHRGQNGDVGVISYIGLGEFNHFRWCVLLMFESGIQTMIPNAYSM